MESPYRKALPVVQPSTWAVCRWCKHIQFSSGYGDYACEANPETEMDWVVGPMPKARPKCREQNRDGRCPDYSPTLGTRLAQLFGGRKC